MAENQNLQTTQVIAKIFGVSTRRVEQLKTEGVIKGQGKPTKYDLLPTIQSYIRYLSDKAYGREQKETDTENESRKIKADADLKATKAEIAELELKELKGEMHRSEDVEAMTTDLVFAIRSMMLALPGRLAIDLSTIDKPSEISERIKQEVHAILLELSNYAYDADAYKKRVRERQGWGELTKDSDDE